MWMIVSHPLLSMQIEGQTVLKFALCYGFRNLQNIVRKIKIGKCDYHFLEVMACPSGIFIFLSQLSILLSWDLNSQTFRLLFKSTWTLKWVKLDIFWSIGCLNGGGQIKPKAGQSAKDLIQSLEAIYMENVSSLSRGFELLFRLVNSFRVLIPLLLVLSKTFQAHI